MPSTDAETTFLSPHNVDIWAEIIDFFKQPYEEYYFDPFEFKEHNTYNTVKE